MRLTRIIKLWSGAVARVTMLNVRCRVNGGNTCDNMLTPVLALIVWTLIVWIWMYATRIPAMQAAKHEPAGCPASSARWTCCRSRVRHVADNYNHLMEQPTIFYALVFYICARRAQRQLQIWFAWAYVALRVVHSLIQSTVNSVPRASGFSRFRRSF